MNSKKEKFYKAWWYLVDHPIFESRDELGILSREWNYAVEEQQSKYNQFINGRPISKE